MAFVITLFLSLALIGQPGDTPPRDIPAVQSLDGEWRVALDPHDAGRAQGWFQASSFPSGAARAIQVPGNIWEVEPGYSGVFWYAGDFVPAVPSSADLRYYLRFGAVGYACQVWLNGSLLGGHEGGQSPFEFDVSDCLLAGRRNRLTVRVAGPYVGLTGGISQQVRLAAQPSVRIKDVFARPDAASRQIRLSIALENNNPSPAALELRAAYGQFKPCRPLGTVRVTMTAPRGSSVANLAIPIAKPHLWDLDDPFLYTIRVTTEWPAAGSPTARYDSYAMRTGFRDFRLVDGYFQLNGKRLFLKSAHSNWYDPISIYGTPRTMKYLGQDLALLKSAGFNMFRLIVSAALPEQLDLADELGMLVYSEHETSWLHRPTSKFGISLNEVVRRDRNHPSLVIWGLLNETPRGPIYQSAKAWLGSLRAIDPTRLVLLSSGRWDGDFKTGSASNPGSATWDGYLGGEDPARPIPSGDLPTDIGAYRNGTGDAHVYQQYPTTWSFITAFRRLGRATKPLFLSEAGLGSSYNALRDQRKMREAGAPNNAYAWRWITPAVEGLKKTWSKYHLESVYPSIESMLVDSEINAARQREIMFSIVRGNPKINGYNLTSLVDCWGAGEGVMDAFREFKPGHLAVLRAGWARLRWCLLANPMHIYAGQPVHLRVTLASEDALPAGTHPATLTVAGPSGLVWRKAVAVVVPAGPNPPLAYTILDEDVTLRGLLEGTYCLSAVFDQRENGASHQVSFFVSEESKNPRLSFPVSVLGVGQRLREFLAAAGATVRDYTPNRYFNHEVILVGDTVGPGAAAWRSLYAHIARGAHAVFLCPAVFSSEKTPNKWLALKVKGDQTGDFDWLYHKDVVAKPHPIMAGLQTKIMTPDYYGEILAKTKFLRGATPPDDAVAIAVRCTFTGNSLDFQFSEGVMIGTYNHHAGRFTVNTLNLLPHLGQPAADRLLLNLLMHARSTAARLAALPPTHDAQLDSLGIVD